MHPLAPLVKDGGGGGTEIYSAVPLAATSPNCLSQLGGIETF